MDMIPDLVTNGDDHRDWWAYMVIIIGIYMVFIWYLYGIYMVFIWYLYGIYMVFKWYLYDDSHIMPYEFSLKAMIFSSLPTTSLRQR